MGLFEEEEEESSTDFSDRSSDFKFVNCLVSISFLFVSGVERGDEGDEDIFCGIMGSFFWR